MSSIRFELDRNGVAELMKSAEMQEILAQEGSRVANNAGPGYSSTVHVHTRRAVCNIYPETPESVRDTSENNTLLKVLK